MELEITTTALKKAVKVVVVVALLIALYFAGKWAWPQVSALLPAPAASLTPTPAPDLAMQAAVKGTEASYTFSAQDGAQAWIDKMCGIVGKDNCVLYQGLIGPGLGDLPGRALYVVQKVFTHDRLWCLKKNIGLLRCG